MPLHMRHQSYSLAALTRKCQGFRRECMDRRPLALLARPYLTQHHRLQQLLAWSHDCSRAMALCGGGGGSIPGIVLFPHVPSAVHTTFYSQHAVSTRMQACLVCCPPCSPHGDPRGIPKYQCMSTRVYEWVAGSSSIPHERRRLCAEPLRWDYSRVDQALATRARGEHPSRCACGGTEARAVAISHQHASPSIFTPRPRVSVYARSCQSTSLTVIERL